MKGKFIETLASVNIIAEAIWIVSVPVKGKFIETVLEFDGNILSCQVFPSP